MVLCGTCENNLANTFIFIKLFFLFAGDEEENDAEEGLKLERERAEHCEAHGADMDGYSKKDDGNGGGGEEGGQSKHDKGGERGGKRKRHRTHRKKPWGLALRDMDLRVMSKYVIQC